MQRNLKLSYVKDKKVLDNISLSIGENHVTAFVGPSGSGKSTITKLIAGFWNAEAGEIKIGGVNIKDIPLEQLSGVISYVSQDNYLFDMSVKENIRIGKPDASDKEIEEIAKLSGCHEFISNLPDGYDTVAGEGGGHLSGGEKQRISIARAMLKDAPIVIFDEATANVDPENEDKLKSAIEELTKNKTIIMIAHQLSTIRNADQILVLNDGTIIQRGNHEELMKEGGLYRNLISMFVSWVIHPCREQLHAWIILYFRIELYIPIHYLSQSSILYSSRSFLAKDFPSSVIYTDLLLDGWFPWYI